MANPQALKNGLAARMKSISALKYVYTEWPDQIIPPCAIITRGEAVPEQTFGRGDLTQWMFDIYLFVTGAAGGQKGQLAAQPFAATSSTGGVFGAIAADRTLGGVCDTAFVKAMREDTDWQVAENVDFYGFVAAVEVWTT